MQHLYKVRRQRLYVLHVSVHTSVHALVHLRQPPSTGICLYLQYLLTDFSPNFVPISGQR